MPLEVVAIDDSTLSLERGTTGEMIVYSPKADSPRELSTVEETDGRDDVDRVGVVLRDLENDFGKRQLFEGSLGSVLKVLFSSAFTCSIV